LLVVVIVGLVYGYLFYMKQSALNRNSDATSVDFQLEELTDEQGQITLEGMITIIDNSYYLKLDDGAQVELKTTQLSMSSYLNKRVELAGKIVRNKLEISKIQEI